MAFCTKSLQSSQSSAVTPKITNHKINILESSCPTSSTLQSKNAIDIIQSNDMASFSKDNANSSQALKTKKLFKLHSYPLDESVDIAPMKKKHNITKVRSWESINWSHAMLW